MLSYIHLEFPCIRYLSYHQVAWYNCINNETMAEMIDSLCLTPILILVLEFFKRLYLPKSTLHPVSPLLYGIFGLTEEDMLENIICHSENI